MLASKLKFIVSTGCILSLTGCATCLDFEDLTSGDRFDVGTTLTTNSTDFAVDQFQYASGNSSTTGRAQVDNRGYAQGSGLDINAREVNLVPGHAYPVKKISFKFGELGGTNNIKINDDFQFVGDLVSINGSTIGGAQVTVNAVQGGNNWYGDMKIEGDISSFSVGGQELWLDNYCYK